MASSKAFLRLKAFWAGFYNRTLENRGSIVAVMFMASLVLWMLHQARLGKTWKALERSPCAPIGRP